MVSQVIIKTDMVNQNQASVVAGQHRKSPLMSFLVLMRASVAFMMSCDC